MRKRICKARLFHPFIHKTCTLIRYEVERYIRKGCYLLARLWRGRQYLLRHGNTGIGLLSVYHAANNQKPKVKVL